MSARRAIFVAPFDELADPRLLATLAADAEAAGWDGFLWDHIVYSAPTQAVLVSRRRTARAGAVARRAPATWCLTGFGAQPPAGRRPRGDRRRAQRVGTVA
jgi:hypothetical protein